MNFEDLFYHFNDEVAVRELREDLMWFGIGLLLKRFVSSHMICAFPTKRYDFQTHKGIWQIDLDLTCFVGQTRRADIMYHLLTLKEFEQWNSQKWEDWIFESHQSTPEAKP